MKSKMFGDIIEEARLKKGISKREIAKKINVSYSTLIRWEKNESVPSDLNTLINLCKELELNFFCIMDLVYPEISEIYRNEFEIIKIISNMDKPNADALCRVIKLISNNS